MSFTKINPVLYLSQQIYAEPFINCLSSIFLKHDCLYHSNDDPESLRRLPFSCFSTRVYFFQWVTLSLGLLSLAGECAWPPHTWNFAHLIKRTKVQSKSQVGDGQAVLLNQGSRWVFTAIFFLHPDVFFSLLRTCRTILVPANEYRLFFFNQSW